MRFNPSRLPPDRDLRQGENGTKSPSEIASATEVQCGLSVQNGLLVWRIGSDVSLTLTPDQAEALAVDLRSFAIEARNGGRQ